jgi:hypothetical protein
MCVLFLSHFRMFISNLSNMQVFKDHFLFIVVGMLQVIKND